MSNQQIIQSWKNKKLRNQGAANPAGPSSVALKHVQHTELGTSPQTWCSLSPKCGGEFF